MSLFGQRRIERRAKPSPPEIRTAIKEKLQAQETGMGRNLDLENCPNKEAAVIAAYTEELARKIHGGLADVA
jgi:hypothetical protein